MSNWKPLLTTLTLSFVALAAFLLAMSHSWEELWEWRSEENSDSEELSPWDRDWRIFLCWPLWFPERSLYCKVVFGSAVTVRDGVLCLARFLRRFLQIIIPMVINPSVNNRIAIIITIRMMIFPSLFTPGNGWLFSVCNLGTVFEPRSAALVPLMLNALVEV